MWNDSELHYAASEQNLNPQTSLGFIDLRRATSAENDEKYVLNNNLFLCLFYKFSLFICVSYFYVMIGTQLKQDLHLL